MTGKKVVAQRQNCRKYINVHVFLAFIAIGFYVETKGKIRHLIFNLWGVSVCQLGNFVPKYSMLQKLPGFVYVSTVSSNPPTKLYFSTFDFLITISILLL